jgi:hypothetical protein
MTRFPCPYLGGDVELSVERERHIAEHHPDLLPDHKDLIGDTLADPDQVRRSKRFGNARLFAKWYDDVLRGKHVVVVVVTEGQLRTRNWIVTAYLAGKIAEGDTEWKRN